MYADTFYFKLDSQSETTNARQTDHQEYSSLTEILARNCIITSNMIFVVFGGAAVIIVVLFLVGGTVIYCVIQRRRQKQLDIIVPEAKTYRETQIVVQVEHTGLLRTDL